MVLGSQPVSGVDPECLIQPFYEPLVSGYPLCDVLATLERAPQPQVSCPPRKLPGRVPLCHISGAALSSGGVIFRQWVACLGTSLFR